MYFSINKVEKPRANKDYKGKKKHLPAMLKSTTTHTRIDVLLQGKCK
jgi:hypothetical protein